MCDSALFVCVSLSLPLSELLVSSAKADLTLQDANKNTALHLACSKVSHSHHVTYTHIHA